MRKCCALVRVRRVASGQDKLFPLGCFSISLSFFCFFVSFFLLFLLLLFLLLPLFFLLLLLLSPPLQFITTMLFLSLFFLCVILAALNPLQRFKEGYSVISGGLVKKRSRSHSLPAASLPSPKGTLIKLSRRQRTSCPL